MSSVRKHASHRSATPRWAPALSWSRAALGTRDLLFPGLPAGSPPGGPPDRGGRWVVSLLGARQVAQAVVTGVCPTAFVLKIGAEIDVAHAATMAALGLCNRRDRRASLVDAVINAAFAMAGLRATHSRSRRALSPLVSTHSNDWRAHLVGPVAGGVVAVGCAWVLGRMPASAASDAPQGSLSNPTERT